MRKIIIGLTIMFYSCGNKQSTPSIESKDMVEVDVHNVIRTIVYKNHEYLLFTGQNKGSLCHSESCKCKSE